MKTPKRTFLGTSHRERGTSTALYGRGHNRAQLRLNPMRIQRAFHDLLFIFANKRFRSVLQLTSATAFEMTARSSNASIRGFDDFHIAQTIPIANTAHTLTRQSARRKHRARRDPVALMP